MSMWLDEPEDGDGLGSGLGAGLGEGLGLDYAGGSEADGEGDDDLLAPVGEGESWDPSQGYPDASLSVRIWVDENKRLTKVRISNRWRSRAKNGRTMSQMFDEAFMTANARIGDGSSAVTPEQLRREEPEGTSLLDWDSLDAIYARMQDLDDKIAKLDKLPAEDIRPNRWTGQGAVGRSGNGMVTVTLSVFGQTEKVDFNKSWLEGSRVSELCDCVMQAHEAAYAAYTPPTFEMGDRMALAVEADRLQHETLALLSRGPAAIKGGTL